MNLLDVLPGMTWRRFCVLLNGLGPNTSLVTAISNRGRPGHPTTSQHEQVITIDTRKNPELVDRLFASMVAKTKSKRKR